MKSKWGFIFICLLICLFSIASVCANEVNETVVANEDSIEGIMTVVTQNDEIISEENNNQIGSVDEKIDFLSANSDGTFTDLANEIANADDELNLTKNYVYSVGDSNGIVINKKITINGKGFIINGMNQARAFNITHANVVLRNIEFTNCSSSNSGYGSAIYWTGANGTLFDCNFIKCKSTNYGGAVYWSGIGGNLFNCEFISCYCYNYKSISSTNSNSNTNSSCYGGAVYWNGAKGNLFDCTFSNCYNYNENANTVAYTTSVTGSIASTSQCNSYSYGGAVYWNGNEGNFYGCTLLNCYSRSYSSSTSKTVNNKYSGSDGTAHSYTYSYSYGGVYWSGVSGSIFDSIFINSTSSYSHDFCYISGSGSHAIANSYSASDSYGGAIYWKGSNGNLYECNFINTKSRSTTGYNYSSYSRFLSDSNSISYSYGGAVYWNGDMGTLLNDSFINCHVPNKGHANAVYWKGSNGNLLNCSFLNSTSSSTEGYNGTVYWNGGNGHQFNCSFDGNYYDYENYCSKSSQSTVYPVILIHTSTLNEDDCVVCFESTQLVYNISVKVYNVTDRKILYDEFNISSNDLISSLNFNNLPKGEYQIVLEYLGDKLYSLTSINDLFKIRNNATYEVTIKVDLNEWDNVTINLTLNEDATGKVKLTLSNYTFINELTNGKTSFNVPHITVGSNLYKIKYIGDDNYNPLYISDTFNALFKSYLRLDLEENYIFDENIPLIYTIEPNCTGIISVYVDNVFKINISVDDVFELENLIVGRHNISIYYHGDEYFSDSNDTVIVTVSKADPSIQLNSSNLAGDVTFEVILDQKATGNITIELNNNSYSKSIIDGKTNIVISNLVAGDYNCVICYGGDSNYNPLTQNYNFTLKLKKSNIIINVNNISFGEIANVQYNLTDNATGKISLYVNDTFIKNITINEKINISDLNAGSYLVKLVYNGDEYFETSENTTTFKVLKIDPIIVVDITNAIYGQNAKIMVNCNAEGNVTITIGSVKTYENLLIPDQSLLQIVNDIDAGTYDVKVKYMGNNNYNAKIINVNLTIAKLSTNVFATVDDITFSQNTLINVKGSVDGVITIQIDDYSKDVNVVANTVTPVTFDYNIPVGKHNVSVILNPFDKNYDESVFITDYTVSKKQTSVMLDVEDSVYGEDVIVNVTASEDGEIIVKIGNITKTTTVFANVPRSINLGILPADSYLVFVTFTVNDNYQNSSDVGSLIIIQANAYITEIQKEDSIYGENVIIKVKTSVDGKIFVNIGDISNEINIRANKLTSIEFGILDAKTYNVEIILDAGNNYISPKNTTTLLVIQKETTLTLNVRDSIYGEDVIVNVTASENGNVSVRLGSIIKNITVEANKGVSIDFGILDIGSYEVKANFTAGDNYINSFDTKNIEIISNLEPIEIDITIPEINSTNDKEFTINLPTNASGTITLTINNENYTFNVIEGVAEVVIPDLDNAEYPYIITYSGDENYAPFTKNGTLTINVIIETVVSNDMTVEYGGEYDFYATFLNSDGTPLVNKYVTFLVDGNPYPAETNSNGIAYLKIGLTNGTYTITSINPKTDENKTNTLIVNPPIPQPIDDDNITIPSFDSGSGTIMLPEDASGIIILEIAGKQYNFTVINGVCNLKVPELSNGIYGYIITYSGDNKYVSFIKTGTLTVKNILQTTIVTANLNTVYNGSKFLVATLKDINGNIINGITLTIVLNGKTYTQITDANGQVKVSTNGLAPKIYTASISFSGNTNYAKSTESAKVTVTKSTPKLTAKAKTFKRTVKTKKYTVTLKDNTGKVMKKVKLTLKIKGKTYKTTTNTKGKATFKITKFNKKGTFKSTITYKGNAYYNKVTKKIKIKIK